MPKLETHSLRWLAALAAACCLALPVRSAVLLQDTPVRARPESDAPVLARLSAGTEPQLVGADVALAPPGWRAVELPGPLTGFVANGDLTKTLEVREGAAIREEPSADGAVLANGRTDDVTEIFGIQGRWTQVRVSRRVIGYMRDPDSVVLPGATQTPTTAAPLVDSGGVGRVVAPSAAAASDETPISRTFQGRFVSTRRPLAPRRPYDYQVNDSNGQRVAFLNVSRLQQTQSMDPYLDREVIVSGLARYSPEVQAIVIEVERLDLR